MNKEDFLALLNKHLSGHTTPEEEQMLLNYFDSFQRAADWDEQALGPKKELEETILHRIQAALPPPQIRRRVLFGARRKLAAAAVIIIVAGCCYLWRSGLFHRTTPMTEIATRFKERRQLQLEDGTQIWMEPGSRISYPEHFTGSAREINLDGEAFFEVAKDPNRPFMIHTAGLHTQVLGTSFNIKAYEAFRQEVAVVTGSVSVQTEGKQADNAQRVVLMPFQKAAYNDRQHTLEKTSMANAADYAQRRYGKFIYQGETVATVLEDIERQYNITVSVSDPAANCTFYGDFDVRQEVDKVLQAIAVTLNATIKKEGSGPAYVLSGGGCASSKR